MRKIVQSLKYICTGVTFIVLHILPLVAHTLGCSSVFTKGRQIPDLRIFIIIIKQDNSSPKREQDFQALLKRNEWRETHVGYSLSTATKEQVSSSLVTSFSEV